MMWNDISLVGHVRKILELKLRMYSKGHLTFRIIPPGYLSSEWVGIVAVMVVVVMAQG